MDVKLALGSLLPNIYELGFMAYQVYFTDFTEENKSLVITILRLKEEAGTLEPSEKAMLENARESLPQLPDPGPQPRRGTGRRRPRNDHNGRNGKA